MMTKPEQTSPSLGLTTSEAARYLGVSLSTIRRWSDLGHLHARRTPGGQRRFNRDELDDFLDSLSHRGAPSPRAWERKGPASPGQGS